ncbi:CPBP family intramembrane metalloprotease [Bacillus sp. NP157]|nr:CPBP family intramembrane metalloprotease [Bacillus sp. NP157]
MHALRRDALPALTVTAALFVALCVRGLADDIGVHIPGLPLPAFGGSSMDNLLAIGVALLAFLLVRKRGSGTALRLLGVASPGWKAPLAVAACTLPFWLCSALTGSVAKDIDVQALLFTALLFPFAEEFVYRGFGFVFPRLGLGWPAWIACLVQAIAFGWIHWLSMHEQGSDQAVMVFGMTFLGAVVFAVLDAFNRYTIWCGLVFHVSLNLAWGVFEEADGWSLASNILRLVCAALAIGAVWFLNRSDVSSRAPSRR